jgi:hypothetical protein
MEVYIYFDKALYCLEVELVFISCSVFPTLHFLHLWFLWDFIVYAPINNVHLMNGMTLHCSEY